MLSLSFHKPPVRCYLLCYSLVICIDLITTLNPEAIILSHQWHITFLIFTTLISLSSVFVLTFVYVYMARM